MRALTRVVQAPADLGVALIGVPEGADLGLDLKMESVSEGVYVSGIITAPVRGECGRCLVEIDKTIAVRVQELFAYENSTTEETTEEDEVGRVQGDLIDLEPTLRDAVVLALPVNPLCRHDCPGLCPECGVRWDELPEGHSHEQIDPRWAALSKLAGATELEEPDRPSTAEKQTEE